MTGELLSYAVPVPEVFSFSVRSGAKRIAVTCTLAGLGGVTIQLAGPKKTFGEADMEVHESTTIDVAPLPKYEYVKRVSLAIEPPSAAETWRLHLAFSTVMRHRVNIEVS